MGRQKKQKQRAKVSELKEPATVSMFPALWSFWTTAGLLTMIVWAVYGQAIEAPLVFDDYTSIVRNESIVSLWPLLGNDVNRGPLNPPPNIPTSARPVVNFSLALNYAAGKLNPAGYRVVNLVMHLLSSMLLWSIVRRSLRLPSIGAGEKTAAWLASAVAILWALHPLQTETVIYITQRTELSMAMFYLATIYCSQRYWESTTKRARTTWSAIAVAVCALGMMSKEVMVSAPLMVLLYERTFVAGSLSKAIRNSWPLYLGLFATWLILVLAHRSSPHGGAAGFGVDVSLWDWWLTQSKVVLLYLKLAIWPWPLQIHYQVPYLSTLAEAWPYLLAVAIMGFATLALLWRNNPVGYLGTWFFVVLSPTSLVPIVTEAAAERRMYLPLAAIVVLLVLGGFRAFARVSSVRRDPLMAFGIATILVGIAFTGLSAERVAAYNTPIKLWVDVVERQPENSMVLLNMGAESERAGRTDEAIEWHNRALKVEPDNKQAHYHLGLIYMRTKRFDDAILEFQANARLEPDVAEHHNNIGAAYFEAKRYEEAIPYFLKASELDPRMWRTQINLGTAHYMSGRFEKAATHFEQALRINPKEHSAYTRLADTYVQLQQHNKAIEVAERALELARRAGDGKVAAAIELQIEAIRAARATSFKKRQPQHGS